MNGFKNYVNEHGLTARQVGERIGLSVYTVRAYMQGSRCPGRKTLKKIADEFQVSIEEVYKWF